MAIEAELKARVREPDRVRELLAQRADEEVAVYADAYYDTPDRTLTDGDRELRVRVIRTKDDLSTLLTYKGTVVDAASGSKPETEAPGSWCVRRRAGCRPRSFVRPRLLLGRPDVGDARSSIATVSRRASSSSIR